MTASATASSGRSGHSLQRSRHSARPAKTNASRPTEPSSASHSSGSEWAWRGRLPTSKGTAWAACAKPPMPTPDAGAVDHTQIAVRQLSRRSCTGSSSTTSPRPCYHRKQHGDQHQSGEEQQLLFPTDCQHAARAEGESSPDRRPGQHQSDHAEDRTHRQGSADQRSRSRHRSRGKAVARRTARCDGRSCDAKARPLVKRSAAAVWSSTGSWPTEETAWSKPPATCHRPHRASIEITSARSGGHRSGGDTRDASQISVTAAVSKEISPKADAGSQPAMPDASRAEPTAQMTNHGLERFGVRRQAHTARPRKVAATKITEERKSLDRTPDAPPGKTKEHSLCNCITPGLYAPDRPISRIHSFERQFSRIHSL